MRELKDGYILGQPLGRIRGMDSASRVKLLRFFLLTVFVYSLSLFFGVSPS
jgi:hypothetical protein